MPFRLRARSVYRPTLFLATVSAVIACTPGALAQTFRGAVGGTLQDQTGAAIPGAMVTATDQGTGIAHTTVTSSAGDYTLTDLPLGQYTVSTLAPGFRPYTVRNVTVSAGTTYSLPIQLSLTAQTTTVEVSANALSLDTASTQQTTTLPQRVVQDVPLNGRDFKKLVGVLPGFGGYSGVLGSINGPVPTRQTGRSTAPTTTTFGQTTPPSISPASRESPAP